MCPVGLRPQHLGWSCAQGTGLFRKGREVPGIRVARRAGWGVGFVTRIVTQPQLESPKSRSLAVVYRANLWSRKSRDVCDLGTVSVSQ